MSPPRRPRPTTDDEAPRDAGVSLVEVLVGMGLFAVLGTVLLGFALSTSRVTEDVRQVAGMSEESRLATERLTRELRQANAIDAAVLSPSGTEVTGLTFWTDFDGDSARDVNAIDPEVMTYRWEPSDDTLRLSANGVTGLLATHVTGFSVDLRSSLWEFDNDGDGVTHWTELDSEPGVGNGNGAPDGESELSKLDLVAISLTVDEGSHTQTYTTQVDLRNNPN